VHSRFFARSGPITRRSFAAILGGSVVWAQKKPGPPIARQGEIVRFADPVTETVVARLTNPRTNSRLPAIQNRFVSARNHFLLFSSDRTGRMAPYHLDLRNGILRQLADPEQLDPLSLCMDSRERFVYFLDGQTLHEAALTNLKSRTVAEGVNQFALGASTNEILMLKADRLELMTAGRTIPVGEDAIGASVRPGRNGCAYWRSDASRGTQFWYAPFPPPEAKPKLLASGPVINPIWAVRGDSLFYLRQITIPPGDPGANPVITADIHEVVPESGADQRVAATSQYAAFTPNANASVFVGASHSKAQPTILLLLRTTGREFTLCEHKSSNAAAVSPVFSPNSQRVYFQSDREGKWTIYSVNVEKLIEPTDI